jgi:hypothetical protein
MAKSFTIECGARYRTYCKNPDIYKIYQEALNFYKTDCWECNIWKTNSWLKDFFDSGFYEAYWGWQMNPETDETFDILHLLNAKDGHILDWCGGWGKNIYLLCSQRV